MKVKINRIVDEAVLPEYAHYTDAGMDLVATRVRETNEYIEYSTGISIELPEGYAGFVFPRSSVSNYGLMLSNAVGIVDHGYSGEIMCRFRVTDWENVYNVGDRIAQLIIMPFPHIEWEEVEELNKSDRGNKGHGSTGL